MYGFLYGWVQKSFGHPGVMIGHTDKQIDEQIFQIYIYWYDNYDCVLGVCSDPWGSG